MSYAPPKQLSVPQHQHRALQHHQQQADVYHYQQHSSPYSISPLPINPYDSYAPQQTMSSPTQHSMTQRSPSSMYDTSSVHLPPVSDPISIPPHIVSRHNDALHLHSAPTPNTNPYQFHADALYSHYALQPPSSLVPAPAISAINPNAHDGDATIRRIATSPSALYEYDNALMSAPQSVHSQSSRLQLSLSPSQAVHAMQLAHTQRVALPTNNKQTRAARNKKQTASANAVTPAFNISPTLTSTATIVPTPQLVYKAVSSSSIRSHAPAHAADDAASIRRIKSSPSLGIHGATPAVNVSGSNKRKHSESRKLPNERAEQRLVRKAEAARMSRYRKKQYVLALEDKVSKLTAQLERLNAALNSTNEWNGNSAVDAVHADEQTLIVNRIATVLNEWKQQGGNSKTSEDNGAMNVDASSSKSAAPATTAHVSSAPLPRLDELKLLTDSYINNSRKRTSYLDIYLSALATSLMPNTQLKFILWGIKQAQTTSTPHNLTSPAPTPLPQSPPHTLSSQSAAGLLVNGNVDGLWQSIMHSECGVPESVLHTIRDSLPPIATLMTTAADCQQRIAQMKHHANKLIEARQRLIDDVAPVMPTVQTAQFIRITNTHPAIHSLIAHSWINQIAQ